MDLIIVTYKRFLVPTLAALALPAVCGVVCFTTLFPIKTFCLISCRRSQSQRVVWSRDRRSANRRRSSETSWTGPSSAILHSIANTRAGNTWTHSVIFKRHFNELSDFSGKTWAAKNVRDNPTFYFWGEFVRRHYRDPTRVRVRPGTVLRRHLDPGE